ncbi:MAG: hypothetical protein Q4G33_15450 [bacterium]|nr:hypothetical protein [bacterium]
MAEYIEREATQKKIGKLCKDYGISYGKRYGGFAEHISEITEQVPIADVAEVKHGKWIPDDYMYYRCSECGYEHDTPEYITPFCPHCGAKMDLGDDEE